MKVSIVGAGLLGTSLGLALRGAGHQVWMSDSDSKRAALAADLVQGEVGTTPCDLAIVATPISAISEVVCSLIRSDVAPIVTDLGSVKVKPLLEVRKELESSYGFGRFVPGHPMAGREISGPEAARGDLFQGRPWILTPDAKTDPEALATVEAMARQVGATVTVMEAGQHDQAMALVSHVPQLLASVLAGFAASQADQSLALAGQGFRDVTRIAASDPHLWTQILAANPSVAALWRQLSSVIVEVGKSLDQSDEKSIYLTIEKGREGRAKLPGKHGGLSTNYAVIPIVIDDRPGQLGALFQAAATFEINIEDLKMEHSPGQQTGLVELAVKPERADGFIDFLLQAGWRVHPIRRLDDLAIES